MENLTQKWTQSGHFSLNQGTFFDFQNRAGEPPPPPLVARLNQLNVISRIQKFMGFKEK